MATKKDGNENDEKDDIVVKRDPEIVKKEKAELARKEKEKAELEKKTTGKLAKQGTGGPVKRITAALAKKESDELSKQDTGELTKMDTGEFGRRYTQLVYEYNFTKEEIAWLVVFLLVILAPMVLPEQFLNDNQVSILLFVVAPVMGWFIRLINLDEKRQRKIR